MKSCLKKVSSVRGSLERVKFSSVFSSQVGKLKKTLALGIYLNSIYWKIGKLKKKKDTGIFFNVILPETHG